MSTFGHTQGSEPSAGRLVHAGDKQDCLRGPVVARSGHSGTFLRQPARQRFPFVPARFATVTCKNDGTKEEILNLVARDPQYGYEKGYSSSHSSKRLFVERRATCSHSGEKNPAIFIADGILARDSHFARPEM